MKKSRLSSLKGNEGISSDFSDARNSKEEKHPESRYSWKASYNSRFNKSRFSQTNESNVLNPISEKSQFWENRKESKSSTMIDSVKDPRQSTEESNFCQSGKTSGQIFLDRSPDGGITLRSDKDPPEEMRMTDSSRPSFRSSYIAKSFKKAPTKEIDLVLDKVEYPTPKSQSIKSSEYALKEDNSVSNNSELNPPVNKSFQMPRFSSEDSKDLLRIKSYKNLGMFIGNRIPQSKSVSNTPLLSSSAKIIDMDYNYVNSRYKNAIRESPFNNDGNLIKDIGNITSPKLNSIEDNMIDMSLNSTKKKPTEQDIGLYQKTKENFKRSLNACEQKSQVHRKSHPNQPKEDRGLDIEDLILLEQKLSKILSKVFSNSPACNECFDWWSITLFCNVYDKIISFIENPLSQKKIYDWALLELMTIESLYEASALQDTFNLILNVAKKSIYLIHQTFLGISSEILSSLSYIDDNPWLYTLKKIVKKKYQTESDFSTLLSDHSNKLINYLKTILNLFNKSHQTNQIADYLKNLNSTNLTMINNIFKKKIMTYSNLDSSVPFAVKGMPSEKPSLVKPPFIKARGKFKRSLVLDLDETMIHFKFVF